MFSWINFLTYAAITAATPGPNNIMSMSNASKLGLKRSLPFNFGVWAGFTIVMIVATFLSNGLHAVLPMIKTPMLVIGAFYIFYLAWKAFTASSDIDDMQFQSSFRAGLILQFINVKIYIYAIVSMEAYILPLYQGNTPILLGFALILSTIGFVFTICWSVFGSLFKALFSKNAKITNTIMALLLVYCAIALFL